MDNETPRKRAGRPPGSGHRETPIRHVRMGPLWDRGKEIAEAEGITMTALVEEAVRREVARRERVYGARHGKLRTPD